MRQLASQTWSLFLLRGILAIIFGIMIMVWPIAAADVFVIFFGAYAFVDGLFALYTAFSANTGHSDDRWLLGIQGFFGVLVGILSFIYPVSTLIALVILIAAWALVVGVLQIVSAVRLRNDIKNEWFLGLAGLISILFGLLIFAQPLAGAISLVWVIGLYGIFLGCALVAFAFRVKNFASKK